MAHGGVSRARRVAYRVLVDMDRDGIRFDVAVRRHEGGIDSLDPRDAALAWEITSGVTKRRRSLDAVLATFSRHPLRRLTVDVRAALRMGAYQLLFLDRVPAHAAVDESVRLAQRRGKGSAGLVNAVLRRVAAEGDEVLRRPQEAGRSERIGVRLSYPTWLVEGLLEEWGPDSAEALLAQGNEVPERCLRVSGGAAAAPQVIAALAADGVAARPPAPVAPGVVVRGSGPWPDALVYEGGSLERTAAFREGLVTPQSRGSQLVGVVAAGGVVRSAAVVDLCAAPGGKAAHVAALLGSCRLLAVEKDAGRADDLLATLRRLNVPNVSVRVLDATLLPPELDGTFDLALVDAPCTGLGTLASRPDLRWRRRPGDAARFAPRQAALLERAARLVRPGGTVVYSVCTMTRTETVGVIKTATERSELDLEDLGASHPGLRDARLGGALLTLPPRDGTSGFFVVRLRRR